MTFEALPVKRLGAVFLGKMIQPEARAASDIRAPYLRAAHIQPQGRIVDVDDKTMWFGPEELRLHDLRSGDVVVVEGGAGYGRSAVVSDGHEGWGFQNSVVRIRPAADRSDGRFIDYALQSALCARRIEVACFTSTIPHFTADKVGAFEIPAPELAVQRAIADYLDAETAKIDALIEKQERLIETLRERRAAVVGHALSRCVESVRLKNLASVTLGKMLDAGKEAPLGSEVLPYLRAANVKKSGTVGLDDLNRMPFTTAEASRLDLRRDDVLVVEGGAMGRPAYLDHDLPGICFQKTLNRVRPQPGRASGRFLFYALLLLDRAGYHSAHIDSVSMPHLTAERLLVVSVPTAPLDEQRRTADYLDEQTSKIDALIAKAERFIEVSKERRSALITAAVTGQIDVRDAAAVSAGA